MKIKSAEIIGLNGLNNHIKLNFNEDLNIITGRNGSGKTNILKLIWYVISGNIEVALREINFSEIKIITDKYICNVNKINTDTCKVTWQWSNSEEIELFEDVEEDEVSSLLVRVRPAEYIPNNRLIENGSSIFLPTFRRIEGGFLTKHKISSATGRIMPSIKGSAIEEALNNISGQLSNGSHGFISSLSTSDIEMLVIKKYSELSEEISQLQQKTSQDIQNRIKEATEEESSNILQEVKSQMETLEIIRKNKMQPFDTFKEQVLKFISYSGIKLGSKKESLSLGDSASAINSDLLSAGEKQMLSFLAYNAFYQDTIFIIDEPELSLHVDWQRILFPTLLKQNSSNQFIVATHSPFIYSKYPDKELTWVDDRGDCNEENQ